MQFRELKINSYKRQSERKKISLLKKNNNSFCKNKEFFCKCIQWMLINVRYFIFQFRYVIKFHTTVGCLFSSLCIYDFSQRIMSDVGSSTFLCGKLSTRTLWTYFWKFSVSIIWFFFLIKWKSPYLGIIKIHFFSAWNKQTDKQKTEGEV